jgi:hypothetical protein
MEWAVSNMLRDLKHMSRPINPQQIKKKVRCRRYIDGWICHIYGPKIAVADYGKNMVQAIRHADMLYAKLLKEKENDAS